jgi:hypothetical protein
MPNHVTNTLEIYAWHDNHPGLMEEIKKYLSPDDAQEPVIDFDAIIPEAYEEDNWYNWRCENWGTKWNAYDQSVLEDEWSTLVIEFLTAWSPPYPIVTRIREELNKRYPMEKGYDISVRGGWIEEGYQSAGVFE